MSNVFFAGFSPVFRNGFGAEVTIDRSYFHNFCAEVRIGGFARLQSAAGLDF